MNPAYLQWLTHTSFQTDILIAKSKEWKMQAKPLQIQQNLLWKIAKKQKKHSRVEQVVRDLVLTIP